jgi:hypothetical protein
MISEPLIILGNGKSLANFDLNRLGHLHTFGLNGAYNYYNQIQWFPKYYGGFVRGPNKWDDLTEFVHENYLKIDRFFFLKSYGKRYFTNEGRITLLNKVFPTEITINGDKYALPITIELDMAYKELQNENITNLDEITDENCLLIDKLNYQGIKKYFLRQPLTDSDYITLPRYKTSWIPPISFEEFIYPGGVAGVIACLVGYLLGYKKIILLGMDCEWIVNNNIVDTNKTYWFTNYFSNKEYNIKEFCESCTPESLQQMHLTSWQNLKEMIQINNLDLEIINCTPNTKLTCFEQRDFDLTIN